MRRFVRRLSQAEEYLALGSDSEDEAENNTHGNETDATTTNGNETKATISTGGLPCAAALWLLSRLSRGRWVEVGLPGRFRLP